VRGPSLSATVANSAVLLRDRATLRLDLPMTTVAIEHRLADRVTPEPEPWGVSGVTHDYHFAGGGTLHGVGPIPLGRDYDSPDLSAVGATLCIEAFTNNPYQRSMMRRCDLPVATPAVLTLHEAPTFTEPQGEVIARPGMRFSWSPVRDASYILELVPERDPSAKGPRIVIYTSRPNAVWPDLSAFGVPFPEPLNTYRVTVSAKGPHTTLDDALAPSAPGMPLPGTTWLATSTDQDLPVRPPLGTEEARCDYLRNPKSDGTIVCSPGIPGSIEPSREWYALRAINNVIRNYPEFAAASGIHCVKDCAQARAFTKAHARYNESHPGFDADQPLGPRPPTPPLPASLRMP